MYNHSKESGDYLSQIRNNISEKTGIIEHSLSAGSLPTNKNGEINIVELGTGGGESLRALKNSSSSDNRVKIVAIDIIPGLAASLKKELRVEAVAADAGNLPFKDESISAINASAIFHEISSYGTRDNAPKNPESKMLYGQEAVIQALGELNRVLLPNGIVAYRDVLAPTQEFDQVKTVKYLRNSWKLFASWFLSDFQNSTPHLEQNRVSSESDDSGFSLIAQAGMQREFQRHYLMLRDYLRQVKDREFGISLLRADWINEKEGLKTVTFSVDEKIEKVLDLRHFEVHDSKTGKIYKGNSDDFDKLYDDLLEYYLDEVQSGKEISSAFIRMIDTWKEREGREHYLYGNISDMLRLSVQATSNTKSNYYLLPRDGADISIAPRYYYDRYLKDVVDDPEKDGKQIITLRKLSKADALMAIKSLSTSPSMGEILDPETLSALMIKMERIH